MCNLDTFASTAYNVTNINKDFNYLLTYLKIIKHLSMAQNICIPLA